MRLNKYKLIKEDSIYEFYYTHWYKGVTHELVFRHPKKEPGYATYRAWVKAGNVKAEKHISDQWHEVMEKIKNAQAEETPNDTEQ
jgi:hypothetical protein